MSLARKSIPVAFGLAIIVAVGGLWFFESNPMVSRTGEQDATTSAGGHLSGLMQGGGSDTDGLSDESKHTLWRLDEYSKLLDPEKPSFFEGNLEAVEKQLQQYSQIYFKTFIHPDGSTQSVRFRLRPARGFSPELSKAINDWDIDALETMAFGGDPEAALALHSLLEKCATASDELGTAATRCLQVTDADVEAAVDVVSNLAEQGYVPAMMMRASQAETTDVSRARELYSTVWERGFVEGIYGLANLADPKDASSVDEQIEVFSILYAASVLKVTNDDGLHPGTFIMERRNKNAAALQTLLSSYPIYIVEDGIELAQNMIESNQACCLVLNGGG